MWSCETIVEAPAHPAHQAVMSIMMSQLDSQDHMLCCKLFEDVEASQGNDVAVR